jgi:hypothetical protein
MVDASGGPSGTGTFRPQIGRADPVIPGYAQLPPVFGRAPPGGPRSGRSTPGSRSRKRTATTETMPYVNIDMLSEQMKQGVADGEYDIVEARTLTQRSVGDYDVVVGGSRRSSVKYDTVHTALE